MLQINTGFNYLFGLPIDVWVQVGLIFATMALATVSVVLGLDTGIKRLSEINIVLAMLLLLLILLTGPTALLLAGTLQNFGAYVAGLVPRTLDMYVYEPTDWFGGGRFSTGAGGSAGRHLSASLSRASPAGERFVSSSSG